MVHLTLDAVGTRTLLIGGLFSCREIILQGLLPREVGAAQPCNTVISVIYPQQQVVANRSARKPEALELGDCCLAVIRSWWSCASRYAVLSNRALSAAVAPCANAA
jgi:hypothetical protein